MKISIDRSIAESWVWKEGKNPFSFREAWIDLCFGVNVKKNVTPIKGEPVVCEKGQSIVSLRTWSARWKWSTKKTSRFFNQLESDGLIMTENLGVTTRVTVLELSKIKPKPPKTNKEEPKSSLLPRFLAAGFPDVPETTELISAWEEFYSWRKTKHRFEFANESSMKRVIAKLYNLYQNPIEAKLCVQQSLDKGWSGFFKIKAEGSFTDDNKHVPPVPFTEFMVKSGVRYDYASKGYVDSAGNVWVFDEAGRKYFKKTTFKETPEFRTGAGKPIDVDDLLNKFK